MNLSNPQLVEKPFFIVGHPRSGTTLLRFLLMSQPRLYIPPETGFLPDIYRYHGRELSPTETRSLLEHIGELNYEWDQVVTDVDSFIATLPKPTLQHVVDRLYRERMRSLNAVRWGDKTPIYVRYIDQLNDIFPQSQFIHIIRDGRDASLSAVKKWGASSWHLNHYYLMANWKRNIDAGRTAGEWLGPKRYIELRYEELVADPTKQVSRLCEFLDESFDPDAIDQTQKANKPEYECHHVEVTRPISRNSIGRYKNEMSSTDRMIASAIAGHQLEELGYEVEPKRRSIADNLRLCRDGTKFLVVDRLRSLLYFLGLLNLSHSKAKRRIHT